MFENVFFIFPCHKIDNIASNKNIGAVFVNKKQIVILTQESTKFQNSEIQSKVRKEKTCVLFIGNVEGSKD